MFQSFIKKITSFFAAAQYKYEINGIADASTPEGMIYTIKDKDTGGAWDVYVVRKNGMADLSSPDTGYVSYAIDYENRTVENKPTVTTKRLDATLLQEHHDALATYLEDQLGFKVIRFDLSWGLYEFIQSDNSEPQR